ncbi:MAG: transcriptional regulator [Rhodobiaceae bacterium]|nr:MAG: transcriptional regulator [Rhodobiaceae bacterium]
MIGEALRLIRVFHDMSAIALAKELGISTSHLSEIERQKKKPSIDLIGKYASVFDTTSSVIMFFSEELDKQKGRGAIKTGIRKSILTFLRAFEGLQGEKL